MKKTYITTMPNEVGAFFKASACFDELGINITRVSYNKAVDSRTLFLEVDGTPQQLDRAEKKLAEMGYLKSEGTKQSVALLEFCLKDVPGSVTAVLKLIHAFYFNISYISTQENGTGYQWFKVGLFMERAEDLPEFLNRAEEICRVRVIDYNHGEQVYDNRIFYQSFVDWLAKTMDLSDDCKEDLLVHVNLAMHLLDEQGMSPYKTFDSIGRFTALLAASRGTSFSPRITEHPVTDNTKIILIEPPCGSNTAIIIHGKDALFIDSGYALYREEMESIFKKFLPQYDTMEKQVLVTHADVDHCGLLYLFDKVLASAETARCLALEYEGKESFREQSPLHKPYVKMCKILTDYRPPEPEKVQVLWESVPTQTDVIRQVGFFDFGELHFEVYEGAGGHLAGETILIDYTHRIVFTGDIYLNLKELTPEQKEHNRYAPIFMNAVDTDAKLCAKERAAILERLGAGNWQIFGAHGFKKDYSVQVES